MLEVRNQGAKRQGTLRIGGVLAPPGRGNIVRLIDDQQVIAARVDGLVAVRQGFPEAPQRPLPLEIVDGGNEPREMRPGIDVDTAFTA